MKKRYFLRTNQEEKVEWWFWGMLFLITLLAFILIKWLLGLANEAIHYYSYRVNPLDEQVIYKNLENHRTPTQDSTYLSEGITSKLTGKPFEKLNTHDQIMAVVIENYSFIRDQQKGLNEAKVVYETLAEGGITRFLALYDEKVDEIGPVRSARPYFITWASEYRAAFAHVGGSNEALKNLKNNFRLHNIDESPDEDIIWRDSKYSAPHNAFTSVKNLAIALGEEKYFKPLKKDRFAFKKETTHRGNVKTILIPFSTKAYEVKYKYDDKTNRYLRFNGGERHLDIQPDNVVIQFTEMKVLDDDGRLYIQTNGTGEALVFRDGEVIKGTWQKDSSINSEDQELSQSQTKFFDEEGDEINLNKGKTWIEVVPNNKVVNYF